MSEVPPRPHVWCVAESKVDMRINVSDTESSLLIRWTGLAPFEPSIPDTGTVPSWLTWSARPVHLIIGA